MAYVKSHILSESHSGSGLGGLSVISSSPRPRSNNDHSVPLISPVCFWNAVAMIKEKVNLSSSNKPLHTFRKMFDKILSHKYCMRTSMSSLFLARSMHTLKMRTKYVKLNWYIGLMLAKSAITKYKMLPLVATGVYSKQAASICTAASSASFTRMFTALEVSFDSAKVLISTSSSRILPLDSESKRKILSSSDAKTFLSSASWSINSVFRAKASGISFDTTSFSNCSSKPSKVTVKLITVTLMQTSGK
mmetsp:Transcript_25020/g.71969  ORF Transcript_25020/g.71969 Transcript_25020/m.71969 type:complete len:248 (-) Transcript_25020:2196-2939(-)